MNSANVQKLGNIQPGVIDTSAGSAVYNKLSPIVLWSAADISSALYVHVEVGERRRSLLERIDHIDKKSGGKLGLFRSGDFPITFSGTIPMDETEDATEAFDEDYMLTADINGDGIDELILPRHQGIVEVYNAEKRLFSFEIPSKKSKRPINEVIYSFRARAKGHDVIYLIFELQDESDGSESGQHTQVDLSERYTILRIDESGINTIILKDMGFNVSKILALGALNKPGSSGIDELMVCSMREEEGERKIYMSRHRPDG